MQSAEDDVSVAVSLCTLDERGVDTSRCGFLHTTLYTSALFELYLTLTTLRMAATELLPFALDAAVPPEYVPSLLQFQGGLRNPSYPTVPISLNLLLQHVSSLAVAAATHTGAASSATSVWEAYVNDLVVSQGPALFAHCEPGRAACYNHSFVNTALVAAVLQRVLTNAGVKMGLLEYIQRNVLEPLAMSDTTFTNVTVDGVGRTTMRDQLRLLRVLFFPDGAVDESWHNVSVSMTQPILNYSANASTSIPFATGITRGWLRSTYDILCAAARVATVTELLSCELLRSSSSDLYVQIADDDDVQLSWMCDLPFLRPNSNRSTDTSDSSSTLAPPSHCALHVLHLRPPPNPTFAPVPSPSPSTPRGVYVFVGVLAVVLGSLLGSYIADYLIHPAPPAQVVLPPPYLSENGVPRCDTEAAVARVGPNSNATRDGVGTSVWWRNEGQSAWCAPESLVAGPAGTTMMSWGDVGAAGDLDSRAPRVLPPLARQRVPGERDAADRDVHDTEPPPRLDLYV